MKYLGYNREPSLCLQGKDKSSWKTWFGRWTFTEVVQQNSRAEKRMIAKQIIKKGGQFSKRYVHSKGSRFLCQWVILDVHRTDFNFTCSLLVIFLSISSAKKSWIPAVILMQPVVPWIKLWMLTEARDVSESLICVFSYSVLSILCQSASEKTPGFKNPCAEHFPVSTRIRFLQSITIVVP